jgi:hypothetical protein
MKKLYETVKKLVYVRENKMSNLFKISELPDYPPFIKSYIDAMDEF